jgi:hypothetical protein
MYKSKRKCLWDCKVNTIDWEYGPTWTQYITLNLRYRGIWQPTEYFEKHFVFLNFLMLHAKEKSSCLPSTIAAMWDLERSMAGGTVTRPGDGQVAEKYALCRQKRHKRSSRWEGGGSTQATPSVEVHWKPLRRPRNATFKFKLQWRAATVLNRRKSTSVSWLVPKEEIWMETKYLKNKHELK